ncbi:DUF4272 domain-containing protein [Sphingobacterium hungaricum]
MAITVEDKIAIKRDNDLKIKEQGYKVNDWLPILDSSQMRDIKQIKGRMSVMNALINIAFDAPIYIIKDWIAAQKLNNFLSATEQELLQKDNYELEEQELNSLSWYAEGLWALMWLTEMCDKLVAEEYVSDHAASLLPNLEQGESNRKIDNLKSIRNERELYTMLDYYYRLHWYCVDGRLNSYEVKLNEGIVYERRKALEWAFNRSNDWNNVEMST